MYPVTPLYLQMMNYLICIHLYKKNSLADVMHLKIITFHLNSSYFPFILIPHHKSYIFSCCSPAVHSPVANLSAFLQVAPHILS